MKVNKKILLVVAGVLLLCATAIGSIFLINRESGNQGSNTETEKPDYDVQIDATATDKESLRELLAKDANIKIQLTDEVEVDEGFVVNGIKTLTGDGTLRMSLGAELGQGLLEVTENSSLILDGPVLDCNYNSDGIHVAANASLEALSGKIVNAGTYGILAYGNVDIKDINIENSMYIAICGQTGSQIHMNGGAILKSAYNHVYLVTGSYMNITGNSVMEFAYDKGIINYGTLEINDGKFGETYGYLCDNHGELTVEYKGDLENGYIEAFGARKSTFLSRKGSTTNISDVYIHDTTRQAIATLGGDTVVSNCKIENTGSHSIDIQNGKAKITDVVVKDSKGSGLETRAGAEVELSNFTVDGCAKIGIACRGAKITANQINISNTERYGMACGDSNKKNGILVVENAKVSGTKLQSVYLYDKGNVELKDIEISDGASRGIIVKEATTAKISGDSIIKNMALGGVEVYGKLEMDSVVICDNNTENSGSGLYVSNGGKVTMNGGAIYNNRSALRGGGVCVTDATLTINGTKIYDNSSANHGGGMYVQNKSVVKLNSGEITNNVSDNYGNGIYIKNADAKVTVAEDFYLGGNDVKVDDVEAVLHISGDSLKKHSASDPLLVTPNYDAKVGTAVVSCKNKAAAKNVVSTADAGDGSYNIVQNGKTLAIEYATADMDMTGADTVYVSTYAELKDAVLSTVSKRNIVLKADIQMEARIRVPGGVTICVTDDGTKRTLSRAEGFTNSFFVTHYGTGLYLTGTKLGNLVLDGGYTTETDTVKNLSLVRVAGSTVLTNVVLQNNGSLLAANEVNGALLKQTYGDFKIYDSILSNGRGYAGGAVLVQRGEGYIEGTVIKNNESTIGGAGVRVDGGSKLEVVDSELTANYAGSTGGGICALGASNVTVTNTKFEANTAKVHGGAIGAQDAGTTVSVVGTDVEHSVYKNNSSEVAGAIYIVKEAELKVTDYLFENNTATNGRAGAVCIIGDSKATIQNAEFYGNKASASGGALVVDASKTEIISCAFGKEDAGNEAGDKAGAILVTAGSDVKMTTALSRGLVNYNTVSYNTAKGVGGVVYVNDDSTLEVENYIFEGNKGASGGVLYIHATGTVVSKNNQFINNTAIVEDTYGNGGAVFCEGSYTDTDSSYFENKAKNGGAVIVMKGGNSSLDGTDANAVMQGNIANVNGGAAVYVNTDANATVTGYTLEENVSETDGSIQVHTNGNLALKDVIFEGDTGKNVYVLGNLDFNNITGVTLVAAGEEAKFVVSGYEDGNQVEFTPYEYTSKVVLHKSEDMSEDTFADACEAITITQVSDNNDWHINEDGELVAPIVATVVVGNATKEFYTLKDAIDYVNANGGTGEGAALEIILLEDVFVSKTLDIKKNTIIVNATGEDVKISRGTQDAFGMFKVYADASLTLGTNAENETGTLVVDAKTDAAINARTVTVYADAGFALAKNATLQNANSQADGAAVYTESTNTKIYGTIKDNTTIKTGAGLDVRKGAVVSIDGATFENNCSTDIGAAIIIRSGAKVTCKDATFTGNHTLDGAANGGAVFCAGTYNDTDSSYIGNKAKNGGAIFVEEGGSTTLTGTDADKAVMQGNVAENGYGGAIFLNNSEDAGSEISITGYTFERNLSSKDAHNAIHAKKLCDVILKNVVFKGDTTQKVRVIGNLEFNNITGATLVVGAADASFVVAGYQDGNVIDLVPYAYEDGAQVLVKAEGLDDTVFQEACNAITIPASSDGMLWYIGADGKLTADKKVSVTVDNTVKYFVNLKDAVAYANEIGGTDTTDAIEIVILEDVSIAETLEINTNTIIINDAGKDITISRATEDAFGMFKVNAGATLTLGTNTAGTGTLIVDGATDTAINARTVTVYADAGFVLAKNATLQNANSTADGAAVYTASANTEIYGAIKDNVTTKSAAALDVRSGAKVTVSGATFTNNNAESLGEVMIRSNASVTLTDVIFAGTTTQNVYVYGNLEFNNITGVTLVEKGANAKLTVSGYETGNVVELTPSSYEVRQILYKADGMSEDAFKAACSAITITQETEDTEWYIDETGNLTAPFVATITVGNEVERFLSLEDAVDYANTNGGTADAAALEIVLLDNVSISEALEITKNTVIINDTGKDITISRGTQNAFDMFNVAADATLTLGTNAETETGKLTVDGATTSAIAGRTVTVNEDAGFVLAKNATLQNANSTVDGAAVYTASANTEIYGTIKDNVTEGSTGALHVASGAVVKIDGALFEGNQGLAGTGALNIAAEAEVTCNNAAFTNNIGGTDTTYKNAGAVYCAGTFNDTNSSYTGNKARNGGAIFVYPTGDVTLTGTDDTKSIMKNNVASVEGGAIYVNKNNANAGVANVTGYILEGNTSDTKATAVYITATSTTTLTDVTFQGDIAQKVYVLGNLEFNNITGATFVEAGADAKLVVSGYEASNTVEIKPNAYTEGDTVLEKADGMSEEDFEVACGAITVTQNNDGHYWYIDNSGKLYIAVASIDIDDATVYYNDFATALEYANTNGGTGTATAIEMVLLENVSISETVSIAKNITIVNATGKEITISRGTQDAFDMFDVAADATLTLGTNADGEIGKLIADGATTSAIEGRTVTVNADAGFVLAKNATLQNANSTKNGAAINTASTNTSIYGVIADNETSGAVGGLDVISNASATISGATFRNNCGKNVGAALMIRSGATVTCENAIFTNNHTLDNGYNGGAVYCTGTYIDKNSKYSGNEAKNGGAIFIKDGTVELTGTDASRAIFENNAATYSTTGKGGAIYLQGGTLTVTGYTFKGNTCAYVTDVLQDIAIYKHKGTMELGDDVTFEAVSTASVSVLLFRAIAFIPKFLIG